MEAQLTVTALAVGSQASDNHNLGHHVDHHHEADCKAVQFELHLLEKTDLGPEQKMEKKKEN